MIWHKSTLSLPDGTTLQIRDNRNDLTAGILFCLPDLSVDPKADAADGTVAKLAKALKSAHIAVVTIDWPEDYDGITPSGEDCAARVHEILDVLRADYRDLAPWFLCYASGRFGKAVFAALGEYAPAAMAYCLSDTGLCDLVQELAPYEYRIRIDAYDLAWEFRCFGMVREFSEASWLSEMTDFIRSCFLHSKKRSFDLILSSYPDITHGGEELTVGEGIDLIRSLALEGSGRAAAMLDITYQSIAGVNAEAGQELDENDILCLSLMDSAADAIRADWNPAWPPYLFWVAAAADAGEWDARAKLAESLMYDLIPELKEIVIRSLIREADEGHSYAAILLGVLAESGVLGKDGSLTADIELPDIDTAISWYRRAAELEDPEGYYRLGRMIEYGEKLVMQRKTEILNAASASDTVRTLAEIAVVAPDKGTTSDLTESTGADLPCEAPWSLYSKAADAGFFLAQIRMAYHLETLPEEERDLSDLEFLYTEILEEEDVWWCQVRLAHCREMMGDTDGAAEAYEELLETFDYDEDLEESWSYLGLGSDRYFWVVKPTPEEGTKLLPFSFVSEHSIALRLGKILLENPDASRNYTAEECFRMAGEAVVKQLGESEDVPPSSLVTSDPEEREALYQYGLCLLKGWQCDPDAKNGLRYLQIAALSGKEEAKPYAAFKEEADSFLAEAERTAEAKKNTLGASEELRRKEAVFRLRLLTLMGLPDETVSRFEKDRTLSLVSDLYEDTRAFTPEGEDDHEKEIFKEIALMEHIHDATVYLVQVTEDLFTTHVSLFYVSHDIEEWAWDRDQLMRCEPFVYAFDLREDEDDICADIGPIRIEITDGWMTRTW